MSLKVKTFTAKKDRVLLFHVSRDNLELATSLLFQAGITTFQEITRPNYLELRAQIPPRLSPTRLLKRLKSLEQSQVAKKVFLTARSRETANQQWRKRYLNFLKPFPLINIKNNKNFKRLIINPRPNPRRPLSWDTLYIQSDLAFGTGAHPTTQMCARFLQETILPKGSHKVLDFGCGTGILSMVARRLGAKEVLAIDHDPQAIKVAKKNLKTNRTSWVSLARDIKPVRRKFHVIVANISLPVLLEYKKRLISSLRKEGHLILSGFLTRDNKSILRAYHGLHLVRKKNEKEWAAILFKK